MRSRGSAAPGAWKSVDNVQFQWQQAEIESKCELKIAKLAAWLKEDPTVSLALDGHGADARANDDDATVAARRVVAVSRALVAAGIAPGRISNVSYGRSEPGSFPNRGCPSKGPHDETTP